MHDIPKRCHLPSPVKGKVLRNGNIQTEIQTDIKTYRQTDRQTDRQILHATSSRRGGHELRP